MKTMLSFMFIILFGMISGTRTPTAVKTYTFGHENVLGTSFDLKVTAVDPDVASKAERVALAEIDRLNNILSSYQPGSEFNQWQRTRGVDVTISPELFEVLSLFDKWKTRTGGALSASAGIGIALWKKAETLQSMPDEMEVSRVSELMRQQHWALDHANRTAKHLSGEPLLLNSFVKSYINGKAAAKVMSIPGVTGCVVNIGGDVVVSGAIQERVLVANPEADAGNAPPVSTLSIANRAIATSGNYRRGYTINGAWYSHILDARTAVPVSEIISATVIAPDPADAGALATAFNILSSEESEALARQVPGVSYQIITQSGRKIESEGWHTFETGEAGALKTPAIGNGEYEMTIELELARFEGRFRRPFVAVWIEDGSKASVRTLALWYNKPRWLADLKRWYSKNREELYNNATHVSTVSSATRSPGRYTLTWDGLDDNGKKVPSGKYTIYLEAAREHGTYQLIHQDFEWNGKARRIVLKGGVEITAASIDCHPISGN